MSLESIPREVLLVVAALAVTIALLQGMVAASRRWLRQRRMVLRMDRAVRGEERAPGWLAEHGFTVIAAQVVIAHEVRIDDRVVTVDLRADYLAERDGARYVVEVKTGALAPKLETPATRRQILEYRIAFDVDGVLLVDGETGRVHEVTFPALERLSVGRARTGGAFAAWALGVILLVAAFCVAAFVAAR